MPSRSPPSDPSRRRSKLLSQLHRLLRDAGLPVPFVATRRGGLSLLLEVETNPLEVEVLPLPTPGPCFGTLRGFGIRYRGQRELSPGERDAMERLRLVLSGLEHRLPARFAEGRRTGAPDPRIDQTLSSRFPFCTVERSTDARGDALELLVRLTGRCNQRCPFCSGPQALRAPATQMLSRLFAATSSAPGRVTVSLTGGEPFLRSDLPVIIEDALEHSRLHRLQIQTNATLVPRSRPISVAPRLSFLVSLHAVDESLYDRCTDTKGLLPLALAGLTQLLEQGHRVSINCVVNRFNVDHLDELVGTLHRRTEPGALQEVHFSILMCPPHRPSASAFLVRYSDAAPRLEQAMTLGHRLGLPMASLLGSTHASIPACFLTEPFRKRDAHAQLGEEETGTPEDHTAWVRTERCLDCLHDRWCLGLPRAYFLLFGSDEIRPVTVP